MTHIRSTRHVNERVMQRFGVKKPNLAMKSVSESLAKGYCGYVCKGHDDRDVYAVRLNGEYGLAVVSQDQRIVTIINVNRHVGAYISTPTTKIQLKHSDVDRCFRIGVDQLIPEGDWTRLGDCKEDPSVLNYIGKWLGEKAVEPVQWSDKKQSAWNNVKISLAKSA